jgi:anti-sigma regulatory factor (Ser/Thr protein kinase)
MEQTGGKRVILQKATMTPTNPHVDGTPQAQGNGPHPADGLESPCLTRDFPATLEGIAAAAACLETFLDAAGCPPKIFAKLAIALDEIASNIINYSGAKTFEMTMAIPSEGGKIALSFTDAGQPYNPLLHNDPDITQGSEQRQAGGLGIFMVKKMMDVVRYEFRDGKNILYMEKAL